jgi:hypothetical protein
VWCSLSPAFPGTNETHDASASLVVVLFNQPTARSTLTPGLGEEASVLKEVLKEVLKAAAGLAALARMSTLVQTDEGAP